MVIKKISKIIVKNIFRKKEITFPPGKSKRRHPCSCLKRYAVANM